MNVRMRLISSGLKTRQPFRSRFTSGTLPLRSHRFRVMTETPRFWAAAEVFMNAVKRVTRINPYHW